MRIDIITLFPNMFKGPFDTSMLLKAKKLDLIEIYLHDLREYGIGKRKQVDDTPYGGGSGMVLRPEPVFAAFTAVKKLNPQAKSIVLTPAGSKYTQVMASSFAELPGLILIAGHYEGFDERIMSLADYQVSVGDYILTGGEIPAMVIVDSVVRLIPGVLGGDTSAQDESFSKDGLLEYPHYTKPDEFMGMKVPNTLLSGHHGEIAKWRQMQARTKTKKNRPDLLD